MALPAGAHRAGRTGRLAAAARPVHNTSAPGRHCHTGHTCRYHCNLNILLGQARQHGQLKWADVAAVRVELNTQVGGGGGRGLRAWGGVGARCACGAPTTPRAL